MTTTSEAAGAAVDPSELRRLRETAGLTQRELARQADCSLSWIANAEGGYVPRKSETLERVLRALTPSTSKRPTVTSSASQAGQAGPQDEP